MNIQGIDSTFYTNRVRRCTLPFSTIDLRDVFISYVGLPDLVSARKASH
jgi:hypothetical protein